MDHDVGGRCQDVVVVEYDYCEDGDECRGDGEVDDDDDDDRAGELLCFLMELQATAMASFESTTDVEGVPELDPKTYVDLPLKGNLDVTVAAFRALPRTSIKGSVSPGS